RMPPHLRPDVERVARLRGTRALRIASRVVTAAAVLLLVAALALLLVQTRYDGAIYPNVTVSGVSLSGQSETEARTQLIQRASAIEASRVSLSYGDQTWEPTLSELGIAIDV